MGVPAAGVPVPRVREPEIGHLNRASINRRTLCLLRAIVIADQALSLLHRPLLHVRAHFLAELGAIEG